MEAAATPPANGASYMLPPAGVLQADSSFVEHHRIRAYEVGPDQHTTIVTIANLLQACRPPLAQ